MKDGSHKQNSVFGKRGAIYKHELVLTGGADDRICNERGIN